MSDKGDSVGWGSVVTGGGDCDGWWSVVTGGGECDHLDPPGGCCKGDGGDGDVRGSGDAGVRAWSVWLVCGVVGVVWPLPLDGQGSCQLLSCRSSDKLFS